MKSLFRNAILLLLLLLLFSAVAPASAALDQVLLTDSHFLTAEKGYYIEAIQADLEALGSPLAAYRETIGGRSTSAAELIWQGSQHMDYGVNPKVLLVTLQVLGRLDALPSAPLMPFIQGMTDSLWQAYSACLTGRRAITLQNGSQYPVGAGANAATCALASYLAANLNSEAEVQSRLEQWRAFFEDIYGYNPAVERQVYAPHAVPVVEPFLELPFTQPSDRFIGITSFFDHAAPGIYDSSILRFDGKTLSPGSFDTCVVGVSCYGGHNALDYRTGAGLPVRAAADGVVVYKYFNTNASAGRVDSGVYIEHNNGYRTAYWHMDPILVEYGQVVKAGDIIGMSGNIGKSSGPHLHFGLRLVDENKPVNPYGWWTSSADPWGDSYWMWKGDLIADSDEAQAQLFYLFYWWREARGYGGDSYWTWEISSAANSTNWGMWGAYIQTPGKYNVYAYWPASSENTRKARYQVFHAGGATTVVADQSAGGDQFVYLGTFNFERGAASVMLSDYTGESGRKVQFDAVKWELTSGTPTPAPLTNNTYDDNDSRIRYSGTWVLDATTGPYQGTRHFSNAPGSSASLDFSGQQVGIAYTGDSDRGTLEVYIDGVLTEVINQRTSAIAWQQRWLSLPVSPGWHRLELRHGGGGLVDLDAVMIYDSVQTGTPVLGPTATSTGLQPTATTTVSSSATPTSSPPANRINLALNKPATQSSSYGTDPLSSRPSNAVDGNTSGSYWDKSSTHTLRETQPWWQVDLGSVQPISQVGIWNRTDCCSDRLANFYVLVSDVPLTSTSLDAARAQPGVNAYFVSEQAGRPTVLDINRTGRYVRVQLTGTNYLTLSEVQVWNSPGQVTPTTSPSATRTTTASSSPPAATGTATLTSIPTASPTRTPTASPTSSPTASSSPPTNRINLAFKKPATQSSTYADGYGTASASRAVDGSTSGNYADRTSSHTLSNTQPWWQVDLGSVQPISQVSIWNRTDCCSDRLANFYVLVSDVPFTSTSLDAARAQPGMSAYFVSGKAGRPSHIDINRTGRYVRIQLSGTNYLTLPEVQVWNLPLPGNNSPTPMPPAPTATSTRPAVTATPTPPAPTITPTRPAATATPTPPRPMPYIIQGGTAAYLPNFARPAEGDNWLGVAGQVFSKSGAPVKQLVVIVRGVFLGEPFEGISLTGIASAYGSGGYEIVLASAPANSQGTLSITLYDLAGNALSEPYSFNTFADPLKNLVLINFVEQ